MITMDETQANDSFWLAGFLDGDGSINLDKRKVNGPSKYWITPRIRFINMDYMLCLEVKKILDKNNIGNFIQTCKGRPIVEIVNDKKIRRKSTGLVFQVTVSGYKRCMKLVELLRYKIKAPDKIRRLQLMESYIISRINNYKKKYRHPVTEDELAIVEEFKRTKPQRLNTNPFMK